MVRLLGDVQCTQSRPFLTELDARLKSGSATALAADFAKEPVFDPAALVELRKDVAETLRSLETKQ